jgi:hypothetical protein
LCDKLFSRRDNLKRHQRSDSHSQPAKLTDLIDTPDALEALRHAKRGYTGPVEDSAYDCDQEHQSRSRAGSNVPTARPATDSHTTLPIRPGAKRSSTKRARKSSSDDEEDSSGDGPCRKKPGLPLLCPFIDCSVETKGPISIFLCVARRFFRKFFFGMLADPS